MELFWSKANRNRVLVTCLCVIPFEVLSAPSFYQTLTSNIQCMDENYAGAKEKDKVQQERFLDCFPKTFRHFSATFGYGVVHFLIGH